MGFLPSEDDTYLGRRLGPFLSDTICYLDDFADLLRIEIRRIRNLTSYPPNPTNFRQLYRTKKVREKGVRNKRTSSSVAGSRISKLTFD